MSGVAPVRETRHAMKLRHKAELKALLAAPAKGIGAKKAQKDAATALEAKQAVEVAEFDAREAKEKADDEAGEAGAAAPAAAAADAAADGGDDAEEESSASAGGKQLSRAQQKKARAAAKDAARMAELRAETAGMKDERGDENAAIAALLRPRALHVKEMVSDGHCLYRALYDQSRAHNLQRELALNDNAPPFMALRQLCAQYMRAHRDDFAPFMLAEDSDEPLSDAQWERYLTELVDEQRAVWGGHTEIVALSKVLQRPINIWSAQGKMSVGEEFAAIAPAAAAPAASTSSPSASPSPDSDALDISFHRHYFGLGNHYNSVVCDDEPDEFDEQAAEAVASVDINDKSAQ